MLTRLSVSNFAIIDDLQLHFNKGLTIITGETGSGKSILLGSLRQVLGERADLKQIKNPAKKTIIEANFDLTNLQLEDFFSENDLDFENESILRRELLPGGKSRAFINDTPVTLDVLQKLTRQLIDIHSQFSNEELLDENFMLKMLDAFAGQLDLLKEYNYVYKTYLNKLHQRNERQQEFENSSLEADYKNFLTNELEAAQLDSAEFDNLQKNFQELQHADEIQAVLQEIRAKINEENFGVYHALNEMLRLIQKITPYSHEFETVFDRIQSLKIELDDIDSELTGKLQNLQSDPQALFEISNRLDLIQNLMNKHRVNNLADLMEIHQTLQTQKDNLENIEKEIIQLDSEIKSIESSLESISRTISEGRKNIIPKLEKELLSDLANLGMAEATMKIELSELPQFTGNGKDRLSFLFSANKGIDLTPVSKSVSGGERSRLMLSIKKLISDKLELPTLILDEIDTGVSGKIANEVGKMLKQMSKSMQLICITHLPQVAAKGDVHFKVFKKSKNSGTTTYIHELSKEERITEIAELLSGASVTANAILQAKDLLEMEK